MSRHIRHQLFFAHPPQTVWQYLTDSSLMEQWLMKNDFRLKIGHSFQFRARSMPELDFDGIVHCEVLEIIPYEKLSYSWKLGPGSGKITIDSVVTWELKEKENGTELSLLHTGFDHLESLVLYNLMDQGWLKNMHTIAELIKTTKHAPNPS